MRNNSIVSFDDILSLDIKPRLCVEWATEIIMRKNECQLPPKNSIKFGDNCFFNTMPSLIPFINRFGVKEVSRIPTREPALMADILLYDSFSGNLLSFIDGTWITIMRTGAVAAITIDKLKKKNTKNYSFIGLGNTARATLLCFDEINNHKEIYVNLLEYKNQHTDFINRFKEYKNIHFNVYSNIEEMISKSDVIVSCVTATDSIFADEKFYQPGVLVVPVHTRGFQNCDLVFDKIFCDDIEHISGFKYFNEYKSVTEMTDVLNNSKVGRESDFERILAYNIGISIQDVYFASKINDMILSKRDCNMEKFWV